jgi:hypothetical protein
MGVQQQSAGRAAFLFEASVLQTLCGAAGRTGQLMSNRIFTFFITKSKNRKSLLNSKA